MSSTNENNNSEAGMDSNNRTVDNQPPCSLVPDESCGWCWAMDRIDGQFSIQFGPTNDVPFDNGEWIPVIPEPEHDVYWWHFPWEPNDHQHECEISHNVYPFAVWKLVAGETVTHLPELCLDYMTPSLACKLLHGPKKVPNIVKFNKEYESVLEIFTSRVLGIQEDVPSQKVGLLNKLFDFTGYIYSRDEKM